MKFHVLSEHLQKSLPFIIHAVSTRNQLPILNNLLLETKDDKLFINATDLEIGIEVVIPASIEEQGGITVPARLFVELINSLPTEKITLQTIGTNFVITGKHTKGTLQTMVKDEFPLLYEEKGSPILTIKNEQLRKIVSRIVFAASTDTTRPSLSGLLMKKTEDGFSFVATDGFRLSLQEKVHSDSQGDLEKPVIVSAKVVREVLGMKGDEVVRMSISSKNNQIIFSHGETVVVGRLIEAEFPNYEKILPKSYSTKVFFDREELLKGVKACAIFARETANIIKLTIKKNQIVVSANAPSVGENIVEVEARLEGEEKEIAFNAKYLLEVLGTIEDDDMSLEMTGPLNPGVFKINTDSHFLHLIMPIKM